MILVLALLLAQENVTLVVKPREKPGVWQGIASAARRLFEKEDPTAADGNALEAQHDHEGALKKYDALAGRLPEGSAAQQELQLDRSSALLGFASPEMAPKAAQAAGAALRSNDRSLKAKAAYNSAIASEQLGKPEDAIRMYQEALRLDPDDADAKVNLELLLKTDEKTQPSKMPGDPKDQKQQQNAQDQQQKNQQDRKGEQQKNQEPQDGDRKDDKERQAQQKPERGQDQPRQANEKQQPRPDRVDRSEAERLLDALRDGEKNLQAWRFAKEKRKDVRRSEAEKDW
jgi:Ca-activated chloride channel family protein